MALTPYKKTQSPFNRNRSSSCSSPVRNRIVYQEIYSVGTNTLVRSYSCDQVLDNDDSGRMFQTTKIQVSSFITPEKQKSAERKSQECPKLSLNFSDKPELSKKSAEYIAETEVIRFGIKKTILFALLTVTSACALYFLHQVRECGFTWDLKKTEIELKENVFGQNQALMKINSVLTAFNSSNEWHVVIFTGGVGVGKTYSSSIISHNFPWSSNKLIPYSEHFTSDVYQLLSKPLSTCGCNLVIVDDLSVKNAKESINLVSLLSKKRQSKEKLLIILIFQSLKENDSSEIIQEFKNTYLTFDHVPFKPLTRDVVEMCFNAEIQRQGIQIAEAELQRLIEEKMKPVEIVKGLTGCKGVAEEVASYYKRNIT